MDTMRPRYTLAAALAAASLLAPASSAHAGLFTITSCTAAQPTPGPWFPERSTTWLMESDLCRYGGDGMQVWMNWANNGVAFGDWGHWRIVVPGALRIRRVRGLIRFKQTPSFWTGISDDTNARWLWGGPACIGSCAMAAPGGFDAAGLDSQSVSLVMLCGSSCRQWSDPQANLKDVEVTVEDPTPPTVTATGGSALGGAWKQGDVTLNYHTADDTGIARTEIFVDGQQKTVHGLACNQTLIPACPTAVDDAVTLSTRLFPGDGAHTVTVRATSFS